MPQSIPTNRFAMRCATSAPGTRHPDEYFRRIDEHRGYPEDFANAMTKADWMGLGSPTFEWMQCLRLATTAKQS